MGEPIVLRCTADPRIGMGHLMRCREMARYLTTAGHTCHLAGVDAALRTPSDMTLFASWTALAVDAPVAQDAERVVALCREVGARRLVLDDYRGDLVYQEILRAAGLFWLQQFDSSGTGDFFAPVLVNASPYERAEHYLSRLRNPQTQLLFGPRYAVLRPEFRAIPPRPDGRPVRRIFAAFGGGDDRGAIDLVLAALDAGAAKERPKLRIVSGPGNPRNAELVQRLAGRAGVEFLVNPHDLALRIAECDLGVIGGGTMSYELAFCGLPMVLVALAPNQERSCRGWADLTGAVYAGQYDQIAPEALRAAITQLTQDDGLRRQVAARGRTKVDGLGVQRLCNALLERN